MLTRNSLVERRAKKAQKMRASRGKLDAAQSQRIRSKESKSRVLKKKIALERAQNAVLRSNLLARRNTSYVNAIQNLQNDTEERFIEDYGPDDDSDVEDSLLADLSSRFDRWYSDANFFKKMTRFSPIDFDALFQRVLPILKNFTLRGSERNNLAYKPHKLSDRIQFFIALYLLNEYPTYITLTAMFVLHDRHLSKYIFRVLKSIQRAFANDAIMPVGDELAMLKQKYDLSNYRSMSGSVFAIDGTEIRIRRPSDPVEERAHYSVKHKQHALNLLVIVQLNGVIRWFSPATKMLQDQAAWNNLGIRDWFVQNPDVGILGDGGFTFNPVRLRREPQILGRSPHKRKGRNTSLTPAQATYNIQLSRLRVVVENTFARLKKWKVLRGPLRHYVANRPSRISPDLIIAACVGLTNQFLRVQPCREDGWIPADVSEEDLQRYYRRFGTDIVDV